MHQVPEVLGVLRPDAGVDVEPELRLDGLDAKELQMPDNSARATAPATGLPADPGRRKPTVTATHAASR